jgi:hypothetical protein
VSLLLVPNVLIFCSQGFNLIVSVDNSWPPSSRHIDSIPGRRGTNYCGSEQFQVKEFNDEDGNPPLSIQEGSDSRDDRLYTKCSPTKVLSRSNPSGTPALRQVVQPKPKSTALFVPYHTYKPPDDFIINDIERYMGGSFSTDTIRAQQVYIYRFCGYLKVGYSYWAARRKQLWNRRHTKKFTGTRWSSHDVPCARIIEGLILRLKAKDRMKMACGECTNRIKWHQEFVSGSWGDVVSIILALKRFFNQSDRFFSEGNGQWRVREDALLELVRLCGDLLRRRCR